MSKAIYNSRKLDLLQANLHIYREAHMAPERLLTFGDIARACKEASGNMRAKLAVSSSARALPSIHDMYLHGFEDSSFCFGLTEAHIKFLLRRTYTHTSQLSQINVVALALSTAFNAHLSAHEAEMAGNVVGMVEVCCQFPELPIQVIDPSSLSYVRCYGVLDPGVSSDLMIVVPNTVPSGPIRGLTFAKPPKQFRPPRRPRDSQRV